MDFLDTMDNYFGGKNADSGRIDVPINTMQLENNNDIAVLKDDKLNQFYDKLKGLGISLDELGDVLICEDNLLVISCAGSGKSTALILRIIKDLLTGDLMKSVPVQGLGQKDAIIPCNVLVCTFLKTGAEELKNSLNKWIQKLGITGLDTSKIKFKTIHAEVYDALKSMGLRFEIQGESNSIVTSVANKYGIRNINATSYNLTVDEINDISSIMAYCRNRLDIKRYQHPLMDDYGLSSLILDGMLKDAKAMRASLGTLDFEDMQEMLLEALKHNNEVVKVIQNRYEYVYIDEFQDTSQLQYELLKYYFNGAKRVMAIGDDDQTIYSWRGSDIEIINSAFENDYKPKVLKLSTNYRCKSNILNSVIPSISKNTIRHKKEIKASKEGGWLNILLDNDVNALKKGILKDLTRGWTVGVLARTNADLLIPAILLELDGNINFTLSKGVHLNTRMAKMTLGIIELVTKRYGSNFPMYLKQLVPKYAEKEAQLLCNTLSCNKSYNLYNLPMGDIECSCPTLKPFIIGLRKAKQEDGVLAYLYILEYLINNVYVGKSQYSKKFKEFSCFVRDLCMYHDNVKELDITDLQNLFSSTLPESLSRRISYNKDTFVKLTTVHESKGKEWSSVYIWGDTENSFPNKVGSRNLTAEEYEEERRVHYIAWTRAKDKLTVFTNNREPGDFLMECNMDYVANKKKDVNITTDSSSSTTPNEENTVETKTVTRVEVPTVDVDKELKDYINKILLERADLVLVKDCELLLNIYQIEGLVQEIKKKEPIIENVIIENRLEESIPTIFKQILDSVWL